MLISVYYPLSEDKPTFGQAKITDIFHVKEYRYTKNMTEVGTFILEIPVNISGAELIDLDMILHVDNTDCLIVRSIEETEAIYRINGSDLKELLSLRLVIPPSEEQDTGTLGYDVVKGSTEKCVKHYVYKHLAHAEDPNRQIFGFFLPENKDRGLNDTKNPESGMIRYDSLDMVVGELCKKGGIGYDIIIDLENNRYKFEIIEPVDKTDNQSENNKVIFAPEFKNVGTILRTRSNINNKNAIYAILGGDQPLVQCVYKENPKPQGIARREVTVNISCDYGDGNSTEDLINEYALKASEELVETDYFEMQAGNPNDYGVIYSLGDKVTFKYKNYWLDSVLNEVIKEFSNNVYKITLVAGDKVPKLIGGIKKNNKRTNTDLKDTILNNRNTIPVNGMKFGKNGEYITYTKYGEEIHTNEALI